jgi:L-lactate utilization protein LutC
MDEKIQRVKDALEKNNMHVIIVDNGEAAKAEVQKIIPEGSQVMQMTSVTLDSTGISELINNSGKYDAAKPKLYDQSSTLTQKEKDAIANLPQYAIGSVHAITESGELVIASNTGSQLPSYAFSAENVVFVVGIQKIVENLDAAMKRIYEYVLPLESERARKAYGIPENMPGSNVSKILIINREFKPDRIKIILVKESLGY